ncbi:MAG TPA: DUF4349 domain-containing protein, partial [Micromonosporaceae bacterium]|nr:DUF4349 domain-containing protein [Micromonosporaceae bacterium]
PVENSSPGFLGGLKAGWKAFVASVNVLLVVIGWLLPFAVAVAIPVVLIIWLVRLRGRRRTVPPAA